MLLSLCFTFRFYFNQRYCLY